MLQSLHSYCCSLPRFALPFTPIGGRNVTTASCDKVGTVWVTSTCSRQIKGGLCQSLTPQSQQLAELQVLRQKLPFYSSMTFVWLCVTFDFSQRWFCEAPVMKRTIKSNQIQCGSDIKQTWKVCVALEHILGKTGSKNEAGSWTWCGSLWLWSLTRSQHIRFKHIRFRYYTNAKSLEHTAQPLYEWIKCDADLVGSLLQYVLGVLHQLLHLSEHVVQADRAPLQGVPQDHCPAPRRAAGRPQQAQTQIHRQQHGTGHLSLLFLLSLPRSREVWRTEGAQPHTAGSVLFGKSERRWPGYWLNENESGLMARERFKLHFLKYRTKSKGWPRWGFNQTAM